MTAAKKWVQSDPGDYSEFDQLNGEHPWREAVPKGYVLYKVRSLKRANVTYFNFDLAKEMGLIPHDHPMALNSELEKKLLATFAIQIVNEFDHAYRPHVTRLAHRERLYMATRYLQLQHPMKNGKTSGDGRCIWNGAIKHNGKIWDVSSRGTGVTCLAPGVVTAGRPLKTGQDEVGYGCGLAELDELYGAAILSEIFHRQGIPTERVLCVVNLGRGYGIGVRAAPNLLRPAHMFLFLKQNDHKSLTQSAAYFIDRQYKNREWRFSSKDKDCFDRMLHEVSRDFAHFAARLDVNYIFAWLDWDGDNVLANGGIIDYGSIRQFGLRHDQYRYDDIDRFSTNLNEQRLKARALVQVFVQMVDFIKTGQKKSVRYFRHHSMLKLFDQEFKSAQAEGTLYRLGFNRVETKFLMHNKPRLLKKFIETYQVVEGFKTRKKTEKVADGVNRPAIFNIRRLLRDLPKLYLNKLDLIWISERQIFKTVLSENARGRDRVMRNGQRKALHSFQKYYRELVLASRGSRTFHKTLKELSQRSDIINREDRVTGNAVTLVVEELLEHSRNGADPHTVQESIDHFIESQILVPDARRVGSPAEILSRTTSKPLRTLLQSMFDLVDDHSEDI